MHTSLRLVLKLEGGFTLAEPAAALHGFLQ